MKFVFKCLASATPSSATNFLPSIFGVLATLAFWILFPELLKQCYDVAFIGASFLLFVGLCLKAHPNFMQSFSASKFEPLADFLKTLILTLLYIALSCKVLSNGWSLWYVLKYNIVDVSVDGREIAKIWAISQGKSMYPDMQGYPFFITLYTPGYHTLAALLSLFTSNVVMAAHSIAYLADVAILFFVFYWIRRETGTTVIALTFPLVLLSSPYFGVYPSQTRPDLLAWLFAYTAAIAMSPVFERQLRSAWVISAAMLAALALMTKQQTAPVALALASGWIIRWRAFSRCFTFGLVLLALVGSACLVLYYLTGGTFFLHTLIYPVKLAADKSITNFDFVAPRAIDFAKNYWGLLLVYGLALAVDLRAKKVQILDWIVLVHIPFLVKIISTWGADTNYFLGILLALGIRAGIFLSHLWKKQGLAIPVVLVLMLTMAPELPGSLNFLPSEPTPEVVTDAAELRDIASQGETLVNSEGSAPFYADGKPAALYLFDVADMAFFEQVGLWEFMGSQLERDISSRRFAHVILSNTYIVPYYLRTILNAYTPVKKFSRHTVYAPKDGTLFFLSDLAEGEVRINGFDLSSAGALNLERETSFGAKFVGADQGRGQGELTFVLSSKQIIESLTLSLYPKVAHQSPNDYLEAQWSVDGKVYKPFLRYQGTGKDTSTDLFEPTVSGSFSPDTLKVTIRIIMSGSARMWYSQQAPIIFQVVAKGD